MFHYDVPRESAKHLFNTYGTTSHRVAELGNELKLNTRIHLDYPFLKSEIAFAARYELSEKPNDVICRRVPLAVLNLEIAKEVMKDVVEIMGKEKKWSTN